MGLRPRSLVNGLRAGSCWAWASIGWPAPAAVVGNIQNNLRLERFMEIPLLKDIPRVTLVPDICSPWECSMGVEAGR